MCEEHPRRSWLSEARLSASYGSRSARTLSAFDEALAPLGLPDPQRPGADDGGWSSRVLRALGIGRRLGL
jgi:hypothetical protein